jgi:hypothetical protein
VDGEEEEEEEEEDEEDGQFIGSLLFFKFSDPSVDFIDDTIQPGQNPSWRQLNLLGGRGDEDEDRDEEEDQDQDGDGDGDEDKDGDEDEDLEAQAERYRSREPPRPLPEEEEEYPLTLEAERQLRLPSVDDWGLWRVKCRVSHGLSGYPFQVLTNSISMVPRKKLFFHSLKQQKNDMKCAQPSGVLSADGSTSKRP